MENFECEMTSQMMQVVGDVAKAHFETFCPTWIKLFGRDNVNACKTQMESHLFCFFKQISDETAAKDKDFNLWIRNLLKEKRELEARLGVPASADVNNEGSLFDYLKKLKVIVSDLRVRAKNQDDKIAELKSAIQNLWNDLGVSRDHQKRVLSDNGCASAILKKLQKELDRCKGLKLAHLPAHIEELREEIVKWTAKCKRLVDHQSPIFGAGVYDEATLLSHKGALDELKSYHEEHEPIFQQLQEYEDLKKQQTELLACEKTADYWKNRGGIVTKNEKKKKAITLKIVATETSLQELLAAFSLKHNTQFTVFGKAPSIAVTKIPVKLVRHLSEADLRLKPKKPFGVRNQ